MSLSTIFANLEARHVALVGEPLPPARPGVTWIWGANGLFKRGVNRTMDLLIRVAGTPPVPGLAELKPHMRFHAFDAKIPVDLLNGVLLHARCMGEKEQQYFIRYTSGACQLVIPPQDADRTRVRYEQPTGALVDIHSHHTMAAFFSATDDRDDMGLSVSAVIGRIDKQRPQIVLRANVYGQRMRIPVTAIFAAAGPFAREEQPDAEHAKH